MNKTKNSFNKLEESNVESFLVQVEEDKKYNINLTKEENISNLQENSLQESVTKENQTQKIDVKKLSFWLSLLAVLIVGVQLVLNYFNVDFQIKIVIEVCSYLLALLLSVGVLKGSVSGKNIVETKENIYKEFTSQIEEISKNTTQQNKTDKNKTNLTKTKLE